MLERLGYGEKELFFVGAADQLHVDRQSFRRTAERKRETGEAGEVQPLAEAHGIAIIVRIAGTIVACAVAKGGSGGYGRKKDGDIAELAKEIGAERVSFGAGVHEGLQGHRRIRDSAGEILAEHRAEE